MRRGGRLLRFLLFARLHRRRALLEAETMGLSDHCVATNSAKLVGDLARGRAIVPHLFQALDALFGPGHCLNSLQFLASRDFSRYARRRERPAHRHPATLMDALRAGQSGAEWSQLGRPQDPVYQGGAAFLQGPDADRLGARRDDLALSRDLHGRDGPFGPHGDGRAFRRLHRSWPYRHGDDAECLRQFEFLAAGRQDPG